MDGTKLFPAGRSSLLRLIGPRSAPGRPRQPTSGLSPLPPRFGTGCQTLSGVSVFHLGLKGAREAEDAGVADGLGPVTGMKGRSGHTQGRFMSPLDVAAWSRRQARESERL